MKKILVIASFLLASVGNAVQVHAAQDQSGGEITQKVSKTAKKLAPQARVYYEGTPQFVSISGTSITYAANSRKPVVRIGDAFYLLFTYYYPFVHNTRDVWLVSASAEGPWVPAYSLPEVIPAIVCSQLNTYPLEPQQLCAVPWTAGSAVGNSLVLRFARF